MTRARSNRQKRSERRRQEIRERRSSQKERITRRHRKQRLKRVGLIGGAVLLGVVVLFAVLIMGDGWRESQSPEDAQTTENVSSGESQQESDMLGDEIGQGAALYNANCVSCHGGSTGGQISDSPPPNNANGHTWHHPDCDLKEVILRGPAAWGGEVTAASMPAFEGLLSEAEITDILAYIKTWWNDEQRETQAENTQRSCQE